MDAIARTPAIERSRDSCAVPARSTPTNPTSSRSAALATAASMPVDFVSNESEVLLLLGRPVLDSQFGRGVRQVVVLREGDFSAAG
jgi:outer membrane protein assembly factor BamE (lipoprotein component of BamABCDE complex)